VRQAPPEGDLEHDTVRFAIRRPSRRAVVIAVVAAGAFATGLGVGWVLRASGDNSAGPRIVVDRPIQNSLSDTARGSMPNVVGLPPEEAETVLFDAGIPRAAVRRVAVPAGGAAGVVVTQDPVPGLPSAGAVTLGVSAATTVPSLVGRRFADARSLLGSQGVRVIRRSVYVQGTDEGTVVLSDPAPGQPLGQEVTLVVASAPSSAFLTELKPVDGGCSEGDASVNGVSYPSSLMCGVSSTIGTVRTTSYLLNRGVARVEATVGQRDDGEPGSVVHIVMRADGRVVADEQVAYGQDRKLDVDVVNALRLSIELTVIAGPNSASPDVVFGSARVIGSPDAIGLLASAN
jgi:hypothetical protein